MHSQDMVGIFCWENKFEEKRNAVNGKNVQAGLGLELFELMGCLMVKFSCVV